jgi:DHA1 family multidrug resistance protein-like MFS transporter
MLGVAIFTISAAVCKDIQTLIICRFFAGLFGASQLSVVPAVLSDLYNSSQRGTAITIYSLTVFVGPFSAPFIGASSHQVLLAGGGLYTFLLLWALRVLVYISSC